MLTCGQSFSHIIVTEKPEHHNLVTTGIYKYNDAMFCQILAGL